MSSIKKSIFSFFKSCDIFGDSFTFRLNKKPNYTSVLGGILSFAFIIYSLYYLWLNLSDFFSKNVRVTIIDDKTTQESSINFSNHNYFILAFCLRDEEHNVNTVLDSSLSLKSFLSSTANIGLKSESCTEDYFKGEMMHLFQEENFIGCKCMNLTKQNEINQYNVELQSKTNKNKRDYIYFRYNLNQTSANATQLLEEIRSSKSKMHVYFPTYELDMNNLTSPFKMNFETLMFDIKPFSELKSEISFSVINFTDYTSLLYDGNELYYILDYYSEQSKLKFEHFNQISFYDPNLYVDNGAIFELKMSLSLHSANYERKLMRYDDFLDDMVGYLSDMIVLLYIFNIIYNSFGAKVFFAEKFFLKNESYQREIVKEIEKKLERPMTSKIEEVNLLDVDGPNTLQQDKKVFVQCIEEGEGKDKHPVKLNTSVQGNSLRMFTLPKEEKSKKNNFELNFLEYFVYTCCGCKVRKLRRKIRSLESSSDFCDFYLDINTYMKKMIEIDMIKVLLREDRPEEINAIENIRPFLKEEYSEKYSTLLNDRYLKHFSGNEQNLTLDCIRNLRTTNKNFYEALAEYY